MARRRHLIYSPEFRAEAVRRVRNSDESLKAIAADLSISPVTRRTWVEASRPKPEVPLTDDARTELRRVRKENRELKMEREILKKATRRWRSSSCWRRCTSHWHAGRHRHCIIPIVAASTRATRIVRSSRGVASP